MKHWFLYFLFFVLYASRAAAQLSPGDLATPHAKLEGMSNCTQCHVLGDKVSNDKCLTCHKEIKGLVDKKRGYHNSKDVKGKDCATCHSDHHGRKFDMVRFDEKKFDHNLAGYKLEGAHAKVDCRQCHEPDYVADANLKKRKDTFLGLGQQCLDCHTDYHQKTLPNDCAKCHGMDDFKPANKFNHDKADFVLVGKHKAIDCKECHKVEVKNGKEFQQFTGIAFKNCNACHLDVHKSHLGNDCKQCHNEQSFVNTSALSKFNHGKTNFTLKGKHKAVDCAQCHSMASATPQNVFQDRLGVKTSECATCHRDPHEGKFGVDCAGCHNENSFHKVTASNLDDFNHALTGFELQGKHAAVDCRKCHTSDNLTDPLPHNTCAACHSDFHEGQFTPLPPNGGGPPDCAACHTTEGFAGSTFSLEQHAQTKFPLDGAHVATPCFSCHLKQDKWRFPQHRGALRGLSRRRA
ncbi:MAG: cytochrome C [Saprospiraceae bacterium]|nr:cytochrome C [Saprospiraceae bacterium]